MELERYSKIQGKNEREIVLLKGFPCKWGKCTFCDYILDNSVNKEDMVKLNKEMLDKVTGEYGVLEVINSGSCFELPEETLSDIKTVIKEKNIGKIFFESHWIYRNRLDEIRNMFNIPITFKCGIETFDENFRNNILKKGAKFSGPEEVSKYFSSICLMVGIKGQTQEMIRKDMEYLLKYFERGCVNIYIENSTSLKRDEELVRWFNKEYGYLEENPNIEVLWNNTDFGVGGEI